MLSSSEYFLKVSCTMLRRFKMTRFPHDIDGRAVPLRELLLVYTALVMQAQNFTLKQCTALRG